LVAMAWRVILPSSGLGEVADPLGTLCVNSAIPERKIQSTVAIPPYG